MLADALSMGICKHSLSAGYPEFVIPAEAGIQLF
jgi:hypothetical protein